MARAIFYTNQTSGACAGMCACDRVRSNGEDWTNATSIKLSRQTSRLFNPNLGGLFRGSFWGGGGGKITGFCPISGDWRELGTTNFASFIVILMISPLWVKLQGFKKTMGCSAGSESYLFYLKILVNKVMEITF